MRPPKTSSNSFVNKSFNGYHSTHLDIAGVFVKPVRNVKWGTPVQVDNLSPCNWQTYGEPGRTSKTASTPYHLGTSARMQGNSFCNFNVLLTPVMDDYTATDKFIGLAAEPLPGAGGVGHMLLENTVGLCRNHRSKGCLEIAVDVDYM